VISNIERRPVEERITVVIPTLGRAVLCKSLMALAVGTRWPASVIVVDQGWNPAIAKWTDELTSRGMCVRHVPSAQQGRAAGLNRGIERVETAYVAITDDDCLAHPDWIQRIIEHLLERPTAIVTGRAEATGPEPTVVVNTSTAFGVQRRPHFLYDSLCGGNMGMSVATSEKIGPFDEDPRLRTAEDIEYAYRALRVGIPIVHAPDVVVHHLGWRGTRERFQQYEDYARSHGGFYGKYLRAGDSFIAVRASVHLFRALRRWARGVATGNGELSAHGRAYALGLLPGMVAGWRGGVAPKPSGPRRREDVAMQVTDAGTVRGEGSSADSGRG
jgi:GT2 family glycosyltransferase